MIRLFVFKFSTYYSLLFVVLVYLAGCASGPRQAEDTHSSELASIGTPDRKAIVVMPAEKPVYLHNAAIKNLLKKSDSLVKKQRYDSAVQELERGLSFAPNNPIIWQKMAEIRLQQGLFGQAEQLAKKSNALSQGDDALRLKNWQIIAASVKAQQ